VRAIVDALNRSPDLRVVVVVPRYPDSDGAIMGPTNRLGQIQAIAELRRAAPDRVGLFNIENSEGVPIYVHAKVCIVDDVWLTCGSDNINRRSWTNDGELTCAVVDPRPDDRHPLQLDAFGDGARQLPRNVRLQLWGEHLGCSADDSVLLDPVSAFALWGQRADALDHWHANGQTGPRPRGQARHHQPAPVNAAQQVVAELLYRSVADPDGRRLRARWSNRF
jgi:phosphatidylserine/phosphatidylglycerophosphate/cardiolipin synthase-like enzyme